MTSSGRATAICQLLDAAYGRPDLGTTNFINQGLGLWVQRADGGFDDIAGSAPFTDSLRTVGWAVLKLSTMTTSWPAATSWMTVCEPM